MMVGVTPGGYRVKGCLHQLLDSVVAKLRRHPLYEGVDVLPHLSKDLYNALRRMIEGGLGVVASVRITGGRNPGHCCAAIEPEIEVRISESVLCNQGLSGLRVGALTLAEAALTHLDGWVPPFEIPSQPLIAADYPLQEMTSDVETVAGLHIWAVRLRTKGTALRRDWSGPATALTE